MWDRLGKMSILPFESLQIVSHLSFYFQCFFVNPTACWPLRATRSPSGSTPPTRSSTSTPGSTTMMACLVARPATRLRQPRQGLVARMPATSCLRRSGRARLQWHACGGRAELARGGTPEAVGVAAFGRSLPAAARLRQPGGARTRRQPWRGSHAVVRFREQQSQSKNEHEKR
jgi:hypothetical protein